MVTFFNTIMAGVVHPGRGSDEETGRFSQHFVSLFSKGYYPGYQHLKGEMVSFFFPGSTVYRNSSDQH